LYGSKQELTKGAIIMAHRQRPQENMHVSIYICISVIFWENL